MARIESALFLSWASMILERELYDRDFVENWVNWEEGSRA